MEIDTITDIARLILHLTEEGKSSMIVKIAADGALREKLPPVRLDALKSIQPAHSFVKSVLRTLVSANAATFYSLMR